MTTFTINSDRLWGRLMALAEITRPDLPWTRRSFSPEFDRGRDWLRQEFESVGLDVSLDTAGNMIGRLPGSAQKNRPLMVGSHSDTVPSGGRFDGTLGVLAGLEAIQTLRENGVTLEHDIELVDFLAEEPSEFGLSCIGSKAMAGMLQDSDLDLQDGTGRTLREAMRSIGAVPEQLDQARRAENSNAAYLELHIEQATRLKSANVEIGVVTDIAAIRRDNVRVLGQTDHAGATPMGLRKDALVTASQMIALTEELTEQANEDGAAIVATIGRLELSPNAANAVPGVVEFTLESRSGDDDKLRAHTEGLLRRFEEIASARRQKVEIQPISCGTAVKSAGAVMQAIETATRDAGLSSMPLSSGAGHDAAYAARLGPAGMLFITCQDGRSHTPEEWVDQPECAEGAQVLMGAMLELDKL
ncbi:MAG: hydantoinase/carbamoylase family amidase [Rhodobacteraceae bacterium]|nr:hydantoinase/carbamoylase family amidase [Paracoccaceae bacterium]